MIALQEVRRTYRKGAQVIHALDGVSLRVERGDFVAVRGPSGSGKSTLMNVIGLLDRPDSGAYRLDGTDVAELGSKELARTRNERIGFVFQAFHLLARGTALANVELPLVYSDRRHTAGLAMRALERVGLGDRAHHLPSELSGGQQQRVAIARALIQEPDLILADEPTGNLDAATGREILQLFRELNATGTTVIVVTHDPGVAEHASREVYLVDGRVLTDRATSSPTFSIPTTERALHP